MANTDPQPWTWPEERWRSEIAKVRAGKSLRPRKWKGGRCAVALTFDCAFEARALVNGADVLAQSDGHYGVRAALPRILRVLKTYGLQATFFMPAVSALLHAETAKGLVSGGHEIGLSSWMEEPASSLTIEAERELLSGAREKIEAAAGLKPTGYRAGAGGFTPQTLTILRELGIAYDSSLAADDDPYELLQAAEPTGIVEMPIGLNDAAFFEGSGGTSPEEVFDIFRRELEVTSSEGGLLVLRLHPEIVGRRSRIWILEEFIKVARTLPNTWITTLADIAASVRGR